MAEVFRDGLEFCVDCVQLIANAETGEGPNGETREKWASIIAQRQVKIWGADAVHLVLSGPNDDDEDSDTWFSDSSCDGCGSTLAGDREYGALVK